MLSGTSLAIKISPRVWLKKYGKRRFEWHQMMNDESCTMCSPRTRYWIYFITTLYTPLRSSNLRSPLPLIIVQIHFTKLRFITTKTYSHQQKKAPKVQLSEMEGFISVGQLLGINLFSNFPMLTCWKEGFIQRSYL